MAFDLERIIKTALAEDIGSGDITTMATVDGETEGEADIIAKENLVVAGILIAEAVFKTVDTKIDFKALVTDGDSIRKGKTIAAVSGRVSAILTGERVALNFLQRLSGIATLTSQFVNNVKGFKVKILDTRKTTPGLRVLEKYAVRMGGGFNHRFGLCNGVLIKDNHIAAVGSIAEAVCRAREKAPKNMLIEVEVKNLNEVKEAIIAGADVIMLDNMKPSVMKKAVEIIGRTALVEASGGINLKNIREIAKTGVDFISVGALTHSARAVDISLEVVS
ncbi:MAG: carboxylating nicotinate-nucleotide diphosphorylase [Deltaproteobacteria bacterium]|nr:carboxylating nicotinate-nucleotide diphosphorylase [Deltaproteobacteria bacterium]MBI3756266.1 carboxylating nicotinate-nucleotide diphosphorylase [Deltaproteobacteria bacterium]